MTPRDTPASPPRGGWTSHEIKRLRTLAGLPIDTLATQLGRSAASIRSAAQRHRISLRPDHERRGRVLHEPPARPLRHRSTDPAVANEVTARLNGTLPPTCTRCGLYPQYRNGICDPCRLDDVAHTYNTSRRIERIDAAYAAAIDHHQARAERKRLLASERQRFRRRKRTTPNSKI